MSSYKFIIVSASFAVYFIHFLSLAAIVNFDHQAVETLNDGPILQTTSGQLHGLHVIKSKRFDVFQYLGVPYAQPPVGSLRFQRPKEMVQNSQIRRDATKFAPTCIQMRHLSQLINPLLNVDLEHQVRINPLTFFKV